MKLTNEDRKILADLGVPANDFPQIERAAGKTVYEFCDRKISRKEAIDLLSRKKWLSGLARSAFHWTAVRDTPTGESVYFDSRKLFL